MAATLVASGVVGLARVGMAGRVGGGLGAAAAPLFARITQMLASVKYHGGEPAPAVGEESGARRTRFARPSVRHATVAVAYSSPKRGVSPWIHTSHIAC